MKARTTQQPDVEIDVDELEYNQLKAMGLLIAEDENMATQEEREFVTVRTTVEPDKEVRVDRDEYVQLERMGLLAEEGEHYESATEPAPGHTHPETFDEETAAVMVKESSKDMEAEGE